MNMSGQKASNYMNNSNTYHNQNRGGDQINNSRLEDLENNMHVQCFNEKFDLDNNQFIKNLTDNQVDMRIPLNEQESRKENRGYIGSKSVDHKEVQFEIPAVPSPVHKNDN